MNRIRIVLADDHTVLREGLRSLINSQADMICEAEVGTGAEAVERTVRTGARVVSLDLSMPDSHGMHTIKRLRSEAPFANILVLTMHDEPEFVRSALAAGARGYLLKASSSDSYLAALRTVSNGQTVIDPAIQHVLEQVPSSKAPVAVPLSRREKEILEQLAKGLTHNEIAERLFVSEKTVETYRHRIKAKTGLKTRADFVRYGQQLEVGSPT